MLNSAKKLKIIASIIIVTSLLLFTLNRFGADNIFMDWFIQGGGLFFGIYIFIQAKRQVAENGPKIKAINKISLELFILCCLAGLIFSGVIGIKTEQFPLPIILISHSVCIILLIILVLFLRKYGYLRSKLLKENQNMINKH